MFICFGGIVWKKIHRDMRAEFCERLAHTANAQISVAPRMIANIVYASGEDEGGYNMWLNGDHPNARPFEEIERDTIVKREGDNIKGYEPRAFDGSSAWERGEEGDSDG